MRMYVPRTAAVDDEADVDPALRSVAIAVGSVASDARRQPLRRTVRLAGELPLGLAMVWFESRIRSPPSQ
eukprot:991857-Pleurochrysis_carterae.AAC.1